MAPSNLNPLAVACPTCRSAAGLVCWDSAYGTMRTRTPHPDRAEAARAAILDREARQSSAWLELAELWLAATEAQRAGMAAGAKLGHAMPAGVQLAERVRAYGAAKHGAAGVAPHWTADACAEHLVDHAQRLLTWGVGSCDPETRELDAGHAAVRGLMVGEIVGGAAK